MDPEVYINFFYFQEGIPLQMARLLKSQTDLYLVSEEPRYQSSISLGRFAPDNNSIDYKRLDTLVTKRYLPSNSYLFGHKWDNISVTTYAGKFKFLKVKCYDYDGKGRV